MDATKSTKPKPQEILRLAAKTGIVHALEIVRSGASPETVFHEVRKQLKEVRSVLRLAGAPTKASEKLSAIFRDIRRRTGGVRDAHAQQRTLETLSGALRGTDGFEVCKAMQERLGVVASRVDADRLNGFIQARLLVANDLLEDWPPDKIRWASLRGSLQKGRNDCLKAMRKACRQLRTEHLHEWRKAAKSWLHQVRFIEKLVQEPEGKLSRHLKKLCELLGSDHDLALIEQKLAKSKVRGVIIFRRVLKEKRASLQKRAMSLGVKTETDP